MATLKFYDLYDEFDFGKYRDSGKTVEEIIEMDKEYVIWVIENVDNVSFSDEVESYLN